MYVISYKIDIVLCMVCKHDIVSLYVCVWVRVGVCNSAVVMMPMCNRSDQACAQHDHHPHDVRTAIVDPTYIIHSHICVNM